MSRTQIDLTPDLLHATGLLWKINHDLLHPLGLAFAVEPLGDTPEAEDAFRLSVLIAEDGEWEFTPEDNAESSAWFDDWYQTRVRPVFGALCEDVKP